MHQYLENKSQNPLQADLYCDSTENAAAMHRFCIFENKKMEILALKKKLLSVHK